MREVWILFSFVGAALALGTLVVLLIRRRLGPENLTGRNLVDRALGWAWIIAALAAAFGLGRWAVLALFAFVGLQGLRELCSRRSLWPRRDYLSMAVVFYALFPAAIALVPFSAFGRIFPWVGLAGLLAVAASRSGPDFRFRAAVLACLWGLVHAPALLFLPGNQGPVLLGFLLLVVQSSDVAQYIAGRSLGRHPLTRISPAKTWEGFVGGLLWSVGLGLLLRPMVPFTFAEAAFLAALVYLLGVAGGLLLSAVKRDLGLKDWGRLLPGHGGMLDRADSLVLAAPVFYYAVRWMQR